MSRSGSQGKPFRIPKQLVWEAYKRVKANKRAPGVDRQSLGEFESDLRGNLYKIWNRMSSGAYFPPPVHAVEIPKPHGGAVRVLGVPTVADRVAQTVAALTLDTLIEFHLLRKLLWVPAPARCAGRGREMPPTVPEEELGAGPRCPTVLRLHRP